jgi:hypothetical protein
MGASTVAGAMLTAPIDKWVGKEFMAKFASSGAGHRFSWPANLHLSGYQPETELRAGPSH